MGTFIAKSVIVSLALTIGASAWAGDAWVVDTQEDLTGATATQSNIDFKDGVANPTDESASFSSQVKRFDSNRKAASITFDQSPIDVNKRAWDSAWYRKSNPVTCALVDRQDEKDEKKSSPSESMKSST